MKKTKKTIVIRIEKHRKETVYSLKFIYDRDLIAICKKSKARWSSSKESWYYLKKDTELDSIIGLFKHVAHLDMTAISLDRLKKSSEVAIKDKLTTEQRKHLNQFYIYLKGKRFSESTLKTYSTLIADFVFHRKDDAPIVLKTIENYVQSVLVEKKISISGHRQFISAMKHYLVFTNTDLELDFAKVAPRKDKKLPNVLSHAEVIELIRVTKNLKHRICIALIYSSGLRIGELTSLKLRNLDLQRKMLKVESGKGRKDRYVPIAEVMIPMLQNYLTTYDPSIYLVEGFEPGQAFAPVSIRSFLGRSCKLAGITKKVTPHTLRHSYATHLLENGTDIRYIQTLLGHTRPETTMIYTHVHSQDLKKITNPLDLIVKQLEQRKKIN